MNAEIRLGIALLALIALPIFCLGGRAFQFFESWVLLG
jgi:hypothetical protein